MVARDRGKPQQAARERIRRDTLVRRSPVLSIGAKALWMELSRGWAWKEDQVCFPHQDVIAESMGAGVRSVKRWIKELCDHKLIVRQRTARGNVYVLTDEIPESVCDSRRLNNKWLAEQVRHQSSGDVGTWDDITPDLPGANMAPGDAGDLHDEGPDRHPPGAKLAPDPGARGQIGPCQGPNWPLDEVVQRKQFKEEEKQEKEAGDAERSVTSSPHASERASLSGDEDTQGSTDAGICSLGVLMPEEDAVEDLDELLEDDAPRQKKRGKSKKTRFKQRAPDLLALPGSGLRTASKPPGGTKQARIEPPCPETEQDVLELLRGEVEEKFGKKAARGLSTELSAKERGQIRNAVLRKYPPDIVLAMIRVLVWDWKVARTAFFPFRPDQPIPMIENLVQYAKHLAAATSTGLDYSGDHRGAVNSYYDIYLQGEDKQSTERPF